MIVDMMFGDVGFDGCYGVVVFVVYVVFDGVGFGYNF